MPLSIALFNSGKRKTEDISYGPEIDSWLSRLREAGGSTNYISAITSYVEFCKSTGIGSKLFSPNSLILVFASDGAEGCLEPLIKPPSLEESLEFVSLSPTAYSIERGISPPENSTGYIKTKYIPAQFLTSNNAQISVYLRSNVSSGGRIVGAGSGSSNFGMAIRSNSPQDSNTYWNGSSLLQTPPLLNCRGLNSISFAQDKTRAFLEGIKIAEFDSVGEQSLPTDALYLLNWNGHSSNFFDPKTISFLYIGPALTEQEEALHSTALSTLQQDLSRIVGNWRREVISWMANVWKKGGTTRRLIEDLNDFVVECYRAQLNVEMFGNNSLILPMASDGIEGIDAPLVITSSREPILENYNANNFSRWGLQGSSNTRILTRYFPSLSLSFGLLDRFQISVLSKEDRAGSGTVFGAQDSIMRSLALILKEEGITRFQGPTQFTGIGQATSNTSFVSGLISGIRSSATSADITRQGRTITTVNGGSINDLNHNPAIVGLLPTSELIVHAQDKRRISYVYAGPPLTPEKELIHGQLIRRFDLLKEKKLGNLPPGQRWVGDYAVGNYFTPEYDSVIGGNWWDVDQSHAMEIGGAIYNNGVRSRSIPNEFIGAHPSYFGARIDAPIREIFIVFTRHSTAADNPEVIVACQNAHFYAYSTVDPFTVRRVANNTNNIYSDSTSQRVFIDGTERPATDFRNSSVGIPIGANNTPHVLNWTRNGVGTPGRKDIMFAKDPSMNWDSFLGFFDATFHEIRFYEEALSDSDRATETQAMMAYWGISP